jgi:hypothetical protein
MEATGRYLGGVYMTKNSGAMMAAAEYCVEPNFIYAPLRLIRNKDQIQQPEELAGKEDYVCSVQYSLLHGGVYRDQRHALDTVHSS